MPAHRTSRFGITGYDPSGSDLLNTIDTIGNTFLDQIDAAMTGFSSGVIASRPTAGTAGRVYLATDDRTSSPNGTLYFDNGTAWVIAPTNNYAAGVIASRPRSGTRGQFYYATDDTTAGANGTLYLFDGTGWNQVQTGAATAIASTVTSVFAAGDIKLTARSTAPTGWLLCDGSAVSRSTYSALYSAISTSYGIGDGSTTFNVPDLRGRAPIGAGTGTGLTSRTLGATGGEETHTLSLSEAPAHTHHWSQNNIPWWVGNGFGDGTVAWGGGGAGGGGYKLNQAAADTDSKGGGGAHNNMQPFGVVNYVIKT